DHRVPASTGFARGTRGGFHGARAAGRPSPPGDARRGRVVTEGSATIALLVVARAAGRPSPPGAADPGLVVTEASATNALPVGCSRGGGRRFASAAAGRDRARASRRKSIHPRAAGRANTRPSTPPRRHDGVDAPRRATRAPPTPLD